MKAGETDEREVRAARNQVLFRALNERLDEVNRTLTQVRETFAIACECADATCVEMIEIEPGDYESVRSNPRHFAVLDGHVYSDVERVVTAQGVYVIVEKLAKAGAVAEAADEAVGVDSGGAR